MKRLLIVLAFLLVILLALYVGVFPVREAGGGPVIAAESQVRQRRTALDSTGSFRAPAGRHIGGDSARARSALAPRGGVWASELDRNAEHLERDDDGQPGDQPASVVRHNHFPLFLH